MDREQENIKIDTSKWDIRVEQRKRNRMKLIIKLSKDEALAYKNFAEVCKPQEVTDADFMKTVFLTGIEALNKQLAEMVQKYAAENRDELAASGITVLDQEDGSVKLASTADLANSDTSSGSVAEPVKGTEPLKFVANEYAEEAEADKTIYKP